MPVFRLEVESPWEAQPGSWLLVLFPILVDRRAESHRSARASAPIGLNELSFSILGQEAPALARGADGSGHESSRSTPSSYRARQIIDLHDWPQGSAARCHREN
jgi:hypothetical protein